jgi:hypothetical protein
VSLDEQVRLPEHVLEVCWVVDQDRGGQRGHGDLERLEAHGRLDAGQPFQELVARPEEPGTIAREGEGAGGLSGKGEVSKMDGIYMVGG